MQSVKCNNNHISFIENIIRMAAAALYSLLWKTGNVSPQGYLWFPDISGQTEIRTVEKHYFTPGCKAAGRYSNSYNSSMPGVCFAH